MKAAYSFIYSVGPEARKSAPAVTLTRYSFIGTNRRVAFHNRYVLGRIAMGDMSYQYNGFEQDMSPGCIYLFHPGSLVIDKDCSEPCEVDYYHLSPEVLNWIFEGFQASSDCLNDYHQIPLDSELNAVLKDLSTALRQEPFEEQMQSEVVIHLFDLISEKMATGKLDPWQVSSRHALPAELRNIWDNPKLLKQDVASLEKTVKGPREEIVRKYGASLTEIFQAMKAEKARELIEDGMDVEQTASSLGFKGVREFAEIFQKSWVLSPGEYRSKALC